MTQVEQSLLLVLNDLTYRGVDFGLATAKVVFPDNVKALKVVILLGESYIEFLPIREEFAELLMVAYGKC